MSNPILDAALQYRLHFGLPVVPMAFEPDGKGGVKKKPRVKWGEFQDRLPEEAEVREAFRAPDSGIALVTGPLSGLCTLDLDAYKRDFDAGKVRETIGELPATPSLKTPRGGTQHIFLYPADQDVGCVNGLLPGVDFKGKGGLSMLPPSKNGVGAYEWLPGMALGEIAPAAAPVGLILFLNSNIYPGASQKLSKTTSGDFSDFQDFQKEDIFRDGVRDENLFHIAHCLVKTGNPESYVYQVLMALQKSWGERDEKWAKDKLKSALARIERRERNIAAEVREWVLTSNDFFLTSNCFQELGLTSRDFQKAAVQELLKLKKAGIIESPGNKRGCYRVVDQTVETLDFTKAPSEEFDIDLPLGLSSHAIINPKNIIIFAGSKDGGKTAVALDFVKRNIGRYPILYMTSEMGETELRKRLEAHEDMTLEKWQKGMQAVYRAHSWADLVTPERKLFVIDYLEPPEDRLYEIGTILRNIHEKLKDGVAVCCIQKRYDELTGRGGQFTLDKARLYVGLDPGRPNRAKIVSCKSFRGVNPRGMVLGYKIHKGWKIEPQGFWKHEERA
ncbi:MAG TPA: bifunctional DNA primase/polymerase [Syntrophales bacterium]|nr:bifunctional DNA primase/polymerase [Syntrophales bacterium]